MPAYFIAHVEVTDAEAFRTFERGFFPAVKPPRLKQGGFAR